MKACKEKLMVTLALVFSLQALADQKNPSQADKTSMSGSMESIKTVQVTEDVANNDDLDNDELSPEDEDAMSPGEKYVPTIEEQLDSLALPDNQAPANVSTERLYSVQTRYAPLERRYELGLVGGYNMTNADFLDSKSVGANFRYHFNDKHSFGLSYIQFENKLDSTGQDLLTRESLLPDVDFISSISEVNYGYNLFYGKFRLGMSKVFYFDQYWNFGAGAAELKSGVTPVLNIEGGLAFWMGKRGSIRLGFKNLLFEENNLLGRRMNHDLLSTLSVNILFGGEK